MDREGVAPKGAQRAWRHQPVQWLLEFVVLFAFWLVLSWRFDARAMTLGAVFSGFVVLLTRDLLLPWDRSRFDPSPAGIRWRVGSVLRFLRYLPWLLREIVLANLSVTKLVLHPRLPVDPQMFAFKTQLRTEAAQVLLAQSITLTPGTITVDVVSDGTFVVHAIAPSSRDGLESGRMQNRVAAVFGEPQATDAPLLWQVGGADGDTP